MHVALAKLDLSYDPVCKPHMRAKGIAVARADLRPRPLLCCGWIERNLPYRGKGRALGGEVSRGEGRR